MKGNIWGMGPRPEEEFYQLPEAEAPLGTGMGGGSGGGGKGGMRLNLRPGRAPTGPLFAPGTLLNWGSGPVTPSVFLDQINADRGKLISKVDGKFVQQPSTGVPEAQANWKRIQQARTVDKLVKSGVARRTGSKYGFGL